MPSAALSSWPTSRSDGPSSPNCRLLHGKYIYLEETNKRGDHDAKAILGRSFYNT